MRTAPHTAMMTYLSISTSVLPGLLTLLLLTGTQRLLSKQMTQTRPPVLSIICYLFSRKQSIQVEPDYDPGFMVGWMWIKRR